MNIRSEIRKIVTRKVERERVIEINALKNVSFGIEHGKVVGIIGTNGSGKSTLLKVLAGIFKPDSGEIAVNTDSVSLLALGSGFQVELTGLENIYINGLILGFSKKEIDKKLNEIVEFSELGEFINYPVGKYSSGMKTRLAFSIACHIDPDILLIDEVLGVGDETFKEKSQQKIRSMIKDNRTVIIVSHSIPTLRDLCDKVMWLHKGELLEFGDTNEVLNNYLDFVRKMKQA